MSKPNLPKFPADSEVQITGSFLNKVTEEINGAGSITVQAPLKIRRTGSKCVISMTEQLRTEVVRPTSTTPSSGMYPGKVRRWRGGALHSDEDCYIIRSTS